MSTFLFDKIIFGPVVSRRLGQSLGINLLPPDKKICNFDCIYCECGLTDSPKAKLPSRQEVAEKLEKVLSEFKQQNKAIDTITFAGNGEPTLHAEFGEIIDDTCHLRDKYFRSAKIALLTNSTTLGGKKIREAIKKIDLPILKLDSVKEETVKLLNNPLGNFNLQNTIAILKSMHRPIIQTMFVKGSCKGQTIDNTTKEELEPWLKTIAEINPSLVMIYTIARDTPFDTLQKVPVETLESIAAKLKESGIETQISG
ncbi:MAG: radical SAM protein [Bacteroidales bacterium]|nr:radical SAM protein [Bacteroidales bacterium]